MDSAVETQPVDASSWFSDIIGEIGLFAARLGKNFARYFLLGLFVAGVLSWFVYYGLSEWAAWKQVTGPGFILLASLALTVIVSVKLSIVSAVAETIQAKQVGDKVLDTLFSRLLGVTDDNPYGTAESVSSLHGMPIAEVKSALNKIAASMLENRVTAIAVPRFALWMANQARKLLVWAAIRVIVANSTKCKTAEGTVDLIELRKSLAGHADELLATQLKKGAYTFAKIMAVVLVAAGWILVELLRRFPGG